MLSVSEPSEKCLLHQPAGNKTRKNTFPTRTVVCCRQPLFHRRDALQQLVGTNFVFLTPFLQYIPTCVCRIVLPVHLVRRIASTLFQEGLVDVSFLFPFTPSDRVLKTSDNNERNSGVQRNSLSRSYNRSNPLMHSFDCDSTLAVWHLR